jgi:uncharacterized protein
MGGLALGGLAAVQWILERRTLGVSGFVERSISFFLRREAAQQEQTLLQADPDALRSALLAATAEELAADEALPQEVAATTRKERGRPLARLVSSRGGLMFVVAVVLGGCIAALQRGTFATKLTHGPGFEAIWGDGALAVLALFGGGVLVGCGTRMAGGCTSGHGLSGCSRLQVGSLVATGTFMGAAVVTTLLLQGMR